METAPTFEMLARLEEVSKTKLLASFFRRVDLEGPVWDHLLSTPVLMTSDEFAPFADAQTLATEWVPSFFFFFFFFFLLVWRLLAIVEWPD